MYRESEIAITCPKCGSEAVFRKAFEFVTKEQKEEIEKSSTFYGNIIESRGKYFIERYPKDFCFPDDINSGMVICEKCSYSHEHGAVLPSECYYQIFLHGERIWAYNREQMIALYEYVAAKNRNIPVYAKYYRFLYNIPRFVFFKKNRKKVLKEIEKKYL